MNAPIEETVTALAAPLALSLGLELWGVEVAFGKRGIVRIFVEGPDGVNIDRCAELSRLLGLTLEVEDVMPGAYVLEVSSPGLERVFFTPGQLAGYLGRELDVALHLPPAGYPDRKRFTGTLLAVDGDRATIRPSDGEDASEISFGWDEAKKVKLVHFSPAPQPKGHRPKKQAAKPATGREPAEGGSRE